MHVYAAVPALFSYRYWLSLGIPNFRIYPLQGSLELRSIPANFHRNALNPIRHETHLPPKNRHEKSSVFK